MRPDFWELPHYAISHDVGVNFSMNGIKLDKKRAAPARGDGLRRHPDPPGRVTAEVNYYVRGPGSYATAIRALENLAEAGYGQPKISAVMTRQNVDQLDEFKAIAESSARNCGLPGCGPRGGARMSGTRCTCCRRAEAVDDWLVARGEGVLTGAWSSTCRPMAKRCRG